MIRIRHTEYADNSGYLAADINYDGSTGPEIFLRDYSGE
jgi:hypothetical protein